MKTSNSSQDHKQPQTETENDNNFNKSLQDLKDLCSQLHFAADSYQSTFLNSNQKQLVVKNTKEYVRNALVTMVDHLGSVSANLDQHLSKAGSIYQTQVKINFLNQKLLTCQDYSHKIAVAKVSCREDYLKYNSRYIKPPVSNVLKLNQSFRNRDDEFKVDEEVPLFLYTCNRYKPSLLLESSTSVPVLAVRDKLSVQSKPQSFQLLNKGKSRRGMLFTKSRRNNEILSVDGSQRI
ncbi:probable protein ABIL5 [Cynara cardunculus var. scolymus]|uniref:probable protein ABIL5 n=1 Tax=Cynara cardunculus var. scolymus TaxID=59895 RepID=UPI000D6295DD|nr:probable protein ABIL5 [Cynara cardunculus var. scolymus]